VSQAEISGWLHDSKGTALGGAATLCPLQDYH